MKPTLEIYVRGPVAFNMRSSTLPASMQGGVVGRAYSGSGGIEVVKRRRRRRWRVMPSCLWLGFGTDSAVNVRLWLIRSPIAAALAVTVAV
jgi:hypothetical protein